MKILELDYKTVNSEATETYIELTLIFQVDTNSTYYECFEKLTKELNPPLEYLYSTGSFSYRSYLEDCNTIKGIIADLEELRNGVKPKSMFGDETRLLRCIEALIGFWH